MKSIKINFVDFWPGFNPRDNFFVNLLKQVYLVEVSEKPDYLFYSSFGFKHLFYDCIRIYFTGEDQTPDFNICDYAIGFSHIIFDDRYFRFPLFYLYESDFKLALEKIDFTETDLVNKSGFCNFIYSNNKAHPNRDLFFDLLNNKKHVDSGGRWKNNIGERVANKLEFQSKFKFSIAFENNLSSGYTTEKIIQAFAAKTIPIYWGNPRISEDFNTDAFINCHDYASFEDVIQRIIEIDSNDEIFMHMMKSPIIKIFQLNPHEKLLKLSEFFKSIIDQDYSSAYRRNRARWGLKYERDLRNKASVLTHVVSSFKKTLLRYKLLCYQEELNKIPYSEIK